MARRCPLSLPAPPKWRKTRVPHGLLLAHEPRAFPTNHQALALYVQLMRLAHLALTVVEDPDREDTYHWLLLEAHGEDGLREHSASEEEFSTASEAFRAGAVRWDLHMRQESEDADPVGDNVGP